MLKFDRKRVRTEMIQAVWMDLDGTLLRDDKTISDYSIDVLRRCQAAGVYIGFSTARGETNIRPFLAQIMPDLVISSGGALIRYRGEVIYTCLLSEPETRALIDGGRRETAGRCEITVDTLHGHYWNYRDDPQAADASWGEVIHTDYADFHEKALKVCIELPEAACAARIAARVADCDWARFSDGDWYKFTKAGATKARAIAAAGAHLGIAPEAMVAFGDDYSDMEMLRCCGRGVAVANAIAEVRAVAGEITEANNRDGVARWLEAHVL